MDNQLSRVTEKAQASRPPLITPSASPPVSRVYQRKDRPSAAKRPRLSATPSRSSSSIRPGSSTPDVFDLRVASRDRLLKSWDQLAERYYKPLDEDDIVDLRDLKILKDRGVTRGAARNYAIGSFAVPADVTVDTEDAVAQGVDEENVGEEEDESADELDLLSDAPVPDVPEPYKSWYVPPPDETNAEDAEAFREFEEAEKKRRELGGFDGEEEEDEPPAPAAGLDDEEPEPSASAGPDENTEDNHECGDDKEESPEPPPSKLKPHRRKSRPRLPSDESDDEFGAWVIDDAVVSSRPSAPPAPAPAPEDDIIDLTLSPSPSPPRRPRGRSISRPPTVQARARSRARSKSKPPAVTRPRKKTPEPMPDEDAEHERLASPDMALQLLTPPRSSSAAENRSLEDEPPPPAETPSPKFPKPRARYTPRPRTPSDDGESEPSTSKVCPPLAPLRIGPPKKAKKRWPPTDLKPEVVISVPRRKSNNAISGVPPPQAEPPVHKNTKPLRATTGKGKERETGSQAPSPETAPNASRRRRSQSQPRTSTSTSIRLSDSPQPPPPSRGVKRRRVSSLSSLSDISPAKVALTPTQSGHSAQQKEHPTRTRPKSGYSSDIPPTSSPVHSDDEDEEDSDRRAGPSHACTGSVASHMSPFPYPPPTFTPYTPRRDDRRREGEERHTPFPTSIQDPQAQFMFAQAWHSLSYLMASGAIPAPPMPGAAYPPVLPYPSSPWPPYTPSHQRHRTHPAHVLDTPSSQAGPSRSSMYSTPTHHPHPYPYPYHPDFSNGTLPPSSPISSPATSSPILRPASVPPGQRSRSRGRRVSFKLDNNGRPLPPTPPRRPATLEREIEVGTTPASMKTPKGKGKGKARAEPEEEEESSEEEPPLPEPRRGRASQRARTPGPPSQREKTVPGSSKGTAKYKAGKRRD
ncbi:hypothetical protein C8Q80DRAFT_1141948 [Daedaleopsis nitida]|nr:hypothetical protein C8Q80DRAFT_1141948 [Daedaleopsis nitida]